MTIAIYFSKVAMGVRTAQRAMSNEQWVGRLLLIAHCALLIALFAVPQAWALTFAEKCAQPGVLKCIDFDNQSALFYGWPGKNDGSNSTICDNDV